MIRNTIIGLFVCAFVIGCAGKNDSAKKSNTFKVSDKKIEKSKPVAKTTAKVDVQDEKSDEVASDPTPPEHLAKAKELIANADDAAIAAVDAKGKYRIYCAACHGFKGNTMVNGAKDLTKSKIDLTESVAQVYFGKGLMTPFKGMMKDEEIIAVSKFIETLRK